MRETVLCPKCKENKYLKWDKENIWKFNKCSKCLLESDLGHPYNPPMYECDCGKTFRKFMSFERHKELFCKLLKVSKEVK